jgi:hypothetical protein
MMYFTRILSAFLFSLIVFSFVLAQDTTLTVSTEGKVGIGVTQPLERLHVNGGLQLDKTGAELNRLILKTVSQNDPGRYGILFSNNILAPFLGDDIGNQNFDFYSKWGNQRTYDAVLSIHGKADGSWGKVLRLTHDGTDGYITTDTGNLIFNPSNGEANVAIGLTTPLATLHVASGGGFANPQAMLQQTGGDGFVRLRLNNSSDQSWDIAGSSDDQLRFFSGSSSKDVMTLTSTQRVGIGTTNPSGDLEVLDNNGSTTNVYFTAINDLVLGGTLGLQKARGTVAAPEDVQNGDRMGIIAGHGKSGFSYWSTAAIEFDVDGMFTSGQRPPSRITFHTNDANSSATERVRIDKDGNVGIGTLTPQGKLDVNGSIYQSGGVLHADYVFEDEYQLESIDEHAAFMWQNKHLKAIPKATIDKNGDEYVEVGAHRKGIVEELEKAHIYIDQLNMRINALESRLEEALSALNEKNK